MNPRHLHLLATFALLAPAVAEDTAPVLKLRELFNGKDLTGWHGEGYAVENGTIVCTPEGTNLITDDTFSNYMLDFEFQLTPGANNGLGIHYPGSGDAAYVGMEVQILDSTADIYKDLKPYQYHGSLYTMVPAKQGALKPVGEWNQERIFVEGKDIRVEVNGQIVLRADLDKLNTEFPKHQGAKRRSGHLCFCGHGDHVAFRNIRIGELPPKANADGVKTAGFNQIFDGQTLSGWKPEKDGDTSWTALNGLIKHDGTAPNAGPLWTEKPYGDFTLVFDWRWSRHGPLTKRPVISPDGSEKKTADGQPEMLEVEELDSGICFRGGVNNQISLWTGPVGSGDVFHYRTNASLSPEIRAGVTPLMKADKPLGEWNRTMVTLKGDRLTVVLNGQKVIANALLPNLPAKGKLALQHHGSSIDFANFWIKEL